MRKYGINENIQNNQNQLIKSRKAIKELEIIKMSAFHLENIVTIFAILLKLLKFSN